jgi:hypothetical protein
MADQQPTRGGQAVTDRTSGGVGITTDQPRRNGQIGVMWLGSPYSTLSRVEELIVIALRRDPEKQ